MALGPEFARPEVGFKAEENQGLLDYFKTANGTPLDPKGQRAPTVQERIDSSLKDFERLIKRPPTTEEQRRIEEIQLKCSGWLEGLKIDLEGKTHVPLEYFNRLVAEHEQMIEFVARDRSNLDAIYRKRSMILDDKIARLEKDLEANDNMLEILNETRAPLAPRGEAADENVRFKAQLEDLSAETQWFKDKIDASSQALYPSNMNTEVDSTHAEFNQIKLIDDNHPPCVEFEQLQEDAKNYQKMKLENSQLKEQIKNLGSYDARPKEEENLSEEINRQIEDKNAQISQLQNRLDQLESDKARMEAECKLSKDDLLENYHRINRQYNQQATELEEAKTTNNILQEALAEVKRKLAEEAGRQVSGHQAEIHQLEHTNDAIDKQQQELTNKHDNWSRKLCEDYSPKKTALGAEVCANTEDFEKATKLKRAELDQQIAKDQIPAAKFQQPKEHAEEELRKMMDKLVRLQKQLHDCKQESFTANSEVKKLNEILSYRQNQNQPVSKDRQRTQITVKLKESIIVLLTTVKDLLDCVDRGYNIQTERLLARVTGISEEFFAGEDINEALMTLKVFRHLDHHDIPTKSPRTPHRESPCLSCEGYAKAQMDTLIELQDSVTGSIDRVARVLGKGLAVDKSDSFI